MLKCSDNLNIKGRNSIGKRACPAQWLVNFSLVVQIIKKLNLMNFDKNMLTTLSSAFKCLQFQPVTSKTEHLMGQETLFTQWQVATWAQLYTLTAHLQGTEGYVAKYLQNFRFSQL